MIKNQMKAARQVPVQSQVSFVVMEPNHLAIVSTHIASNYSFDSVLQRYIYHQSLELWYPYLFIRIECVIRGEYMNAHLSFFCCCLWAHVRFTSPKNRNHVLNYRRRMSNPYQDSIYMNFLDVRGRFLTVQKYAFFFVFNKAARYQDKYKFLFLFISPPFVKTKWS
jgi:hypothetical protein